MFGARLVSADAEGREFVSPPSFCMWSDLYQGDDFSGCAINCLEQLVCCLFQFFNGVDRACECPIHLVDVGVEYCCVRVPIHFLVVKSFHVRAWEESEVDLGDN